MITLNLTKAVFAFRQLEKFFLYNYTNETAYLRLTGSVFGSVLSDSPISEGSFGQKNDITVFKKFEGLAAVFG